MFLMRFTGLDTYLINSLSVVQFQLATFNACSSPLSPEVYGAFISVKISGTRILTQRTLITVTVCWWLVAQAKPVWALQGLPAHCVRACASLENRLHLLLLLLPPVPKLTQKTHTHIHPLTHTFARFSRGVHCIRCFGGWCKMNQQQ